MSTVAQSEMTIEEFLALPEDGMDRELVRGKLWERAMTTGITAAQLFGMQ